MKNGKNGLRNESLLSRDAGVYHKRYGLVFHNIIIYGSGILDAERNGLCLITLTVVKEYAVC